MAGERILIVDDTPVNLKLTHVLLSRHEFETETAASAEEALERMAVRLPDLVIADIQLPGMDGLELTRRIKNDPAMTSVAVVALSALASPEDRRRAEAAGCDGYITKPIDTRALPGDLRTILERRAAPGVARREPAAAAPRPLPDMDELRLRFLRDGADAIGRFQAEFDGDFPADEACGAAHQWVGAAGLLGLPELSRLARVLENLLRRKPVDNDELQAALDALEREFANPTRRAG